VRRVHGQRPEVHRHQGHGQGRQGGPWPVPTEEVTDGATPLHCHHWSGEDPEYLQTSCPLSRLWSRGHFSELELPQHYAKKPRSLPLYRLHAPVYGLHKLCYGLLRRAAGQERAAGRGRAAGGQDGLLG
jgi:hypothetical protein